MTEPTDTRVESFPDDVIRAWYVVHGFTKQVDLCICATIDKALHVVYATLARYPADASPWRRPGVDQQAVFNAYVLDAWDLLTHGGSVDSGAFRTAKGETLFRAMRRLDNAGLPLLPGFEHIDAMGEAWDPVDPPSGWLSGPWWTIPLQQEPKS